MRTSVLHVGKTGGTALISALRSAGTNEELEFHGHVATLKWLWSKNPRRRVIFGVREPVSRFVSAFNSRLRQGRPRHFTPWNKGEEIAFSLFDSPNELAEAIYAEDRLRRAVA